METMTQIERTALLTLYCRYKVSTGQKPYLSDPFAEWYVQTHGAPEFDSPIAERVLQGTPVRSMIIDKMIKKELMGRKQLNIVSVACGFDARWQHFLSGGQKNCKVNFYEIDSLNLLEAKKEIISSSPFHQTYSRVQQVPADLRLGFPKTLQLKKTPTIVIIEGLTMYLSKAEMNALLVSVRQQIEQPIIIFDTYNEKALEYANKDKGTSTGTESVLFQWAPKSITKHYNSHGWAIKEKHSIIGGILKKYRSPFLSYVVTPLLPQKYVLLKLVAT